jgi:hypothetical protein
MDKDTIKKTVENPRLIPGIHNYCDRWCERCLMTAHCAVFAMEQAESGSPLSCDPENEAFWQQLKNSLKTALELLQEMAQEAGVDLDTLIPEEDHASKARLKKEAEELVALLHELLGDIHEGCFPSESAKPAIRHQKDFSPSAQNDTY